MRTAVDQLAFHEAYQDRLRPVFLRHPEQILAQPREQASTATHPRPGGNTSSIATERTSQSSENMDPQWRELEAQIADMGVPLTSSLPCGARARETSNARGTQRQQPNARDPAPSSSRPAVAPRPHRPTPSHPERGAQRPWPNPQEPTTADVVERLARMQTRAKPPSKQEVDTLLCEIEAHLVRAQEEEERSRAVAAASGRSVHVRTRPRPHPASPTRRARSPPQTSPSSSSLRSASALEPVHRSGEHPIAPHQRRQRPPHRGNRAVHGANESDEAALAKWHRQYTDWRDAYMTWYNTYYDAYQTYYNEAPAGPPPFVPLDNDTSHSESPPPRSCADTRELARRTQGRNPSRYRPPPRSSSSGRQPPQTAVRATARRGDVLRVQQQRGAHHDGDVRHADPTGAVSFQGERTPRRPAPLPPSQSTSLSRATSVGGADAQYFPHTLRAPSTSSVRDRTRRDTQQPQRPSWRN